MNLLCLVMLVKGNRMNDKWWKEKDFRLFLKWWLKKYCKSFQAEGISPAVEMLNVVLEPWNYSDDYMEFKVRDEWLN